MARPEPLSWRAVIALLANADTRAVLAEHVGDAALTPAARERARTRLVEAGVLVADGAGGWVIAEDRLRATLQAGSTPRSAGPERFLDSDGRLMGYPSKAPDRLELLQMLGPRVVGRDEDLPEAVLNARLEKLTDDVATLRRYLVEAEVLERFPDGSGYRLVR
ncbi:MAG: hypothetical protein CVT62_07715 [Actinobacteria bacterium HGW-Actinobacteria-2]|nr:MAG: hypothetical protein CVT62_07715 [Actinobacteria bacterium HGW-Actinobacteria-2]